MADDDQQHDDTQDSNLVRELRQQLKAANKELGELRPYREQRVLMQAGFDPDSKRAKALLKLHDGELSVEALKATAEEYEYEPNLTIEAAEPVDEVAEARSQTIQRVDELRSNATPVGAQRIDYESYQQMQQQNPAAAAQALAAGTVDLPPHIAAVVQANRAEREQRQLA